MVPREIPDDWLLCCDIGVVTICLPLILLNIEIMCVYYSACYYDDCYLWLMVDPTGLECHRTDPWVVCGYPQQVEQVISL